MIIQQWLSTTTSRLTNAGIGTARLDSLVLLEDVTGKNRAWLLAHPEHELEASSFHDLEKLTTRREKHEPLAYIRGKTEFYGRTFMVNKHVLEPRPESETMIELLKQITINKPTTIIDIGTGSGALAITAKLELPATNVVAIDIDENCLAVAEQNAKNLRADITYHQGDLLSPVPQDGLPWQNCVVLANLPYVPDSYQINRAALSEPRIAIFGGTDGLELYRRLFTQLEELPVRPRTILTESLPFQHAELTTIAQDHGFQPDLEEDFIQTFVPIEA